MDRPYKYITVLDYLKGQVYVYDYDQREISAVNLVSKFHDLDNVHYMVHQYTPALWTKNLYFCSREEAYQLHNEEQE